MASVEITGDKRLMRQLRAIGGGGQRRIIRPAITKATKPVVKMARSLVPVDEGLLKKAIGVQVTTYKRTGAVIARIGARSGFGEIDEDGKKRDPTKYEHLVEMGTIFAPPQPHLRPAMDSNRGTIKQIINKEVGQRIKKELAKTK